MSETNRQSAIVNLLSTGAIRIYSHSDARIQALLLGLADDYQHEVVTAQTAWSLPALLVTGSTERIPEPIASAATQGQAAIIAVILGASVPSVPVFAFLPPTAPDQVVKQTIRSGLEKLEVTSRLEKVQKELERAQVEIEELNRIGVALSSERDTRRLLGLMLSKMREISRSDAGSLYLVEEGETGERRLRFKLVQNDSIPAELTEFAMPIDSSSIAGYVALTGKTVVLEDAYHIAGEFPFRLNLRMDLGTGYRTKSMLVIPMKNIKEEILGVIQLINCKRNASERITLETAERVVIPYDEAVARIVTSLASQAAVALENSRLYESIENLFESFVKASIVAIEARDPTTSGHSFRVAQMTVALAEVVDRVDEGPYREVRFNREQMKELRYASLLHDFGKVGVREEVLVKAKKLYPWQLDQIRERFAYVRRTLSEEHSRRKLDYILEKGREQYLTNEEILDQEAVERLRQIDDFQRFIVEYNEPTVLPKSDFQRLVDIAATRYVDWEGQQKPLLTAEELRLLSIPKGSLDERERQQIESHVVHTYNFLRQMPWTKEIRNIPLIARAHHEKLDGSGYPFKLKEPEIPVQSKMMTIADIYDALVASDRPYKRAVRSDRALDIIEQSVRQSEIDRELFRIFVQGEIWRLLQK